MARGYRARRDERYRRPSPPRTGARPGRRSVLYSSECSSGKWSWDTRALAADYLAGRDKDIRGQLHPYECNECGRYHLGHQPAAVRLGLVGRVECYAATPAEAREWNRLAEAYRLGDYPDEETGVAS